ncbi:hypothetical protein FHE74_05730 [Corynebacterium tapiri]|uniref:NlpC/P60 domain-containing protein n=1 Tax=Corynebacterium tapiri TaxID=1448266 RepID=A0A5C4U4E1_9CORY|nr:NlpC/P60 family protein [Corynebacterium tapiri]TNL97590.1 hypothetical protein FHE74_05730 [Corynebacterium tapiri]
MAPTLQKRRAYAVAGAAALSVMSGTATAHANPINDLSSTAGEAQQHLTELENILKTLESLGVTASPSTDSANAVVDLDATNRALSSAQQDLARTTQALQQAQKLLDDLSRAVFADGNSTVTPQQVERQRSVVRSLEAQRATQAAKETELTTLRDQAADHEKAITSTNNAETATASAVSEPEKPMESAESATGGVDTPTAEENSTATPTVAAEGSVDTPSVAETSAVATDESQKTSTPEAASAGDIESVVQRALAQVGTPYAWGGGTNDGPSAGLRDGGVGDANGDYGKVGFDCSGLVKYAFAAAGLDLPHYSGYMYNRGTAVDPSEMQRGDLIFYGPGGSEHVAIYLGDGTMVEAPASGQTVQVAPVRFEGMADKVVRLL